jgi:GT2 family glycosyltransferase
LTLDCLASLSRQDYPNHTTILVDNGSSDDSVTQVRSRFPAVILLENKENLGYSEGNNVGLRFALRQAADYIFLLNNDTLLDPALIRQLVAAAETDPRIGLVGPTMFYADHPEVIWAGENRIDWRAARPVRARMGERVAAAELAGQPPREADYIDTCAVLVCRRVFEQVGLLDSRFFINFDDLDFNRRAAKAGFRILYLPPARMWHRVSAAMGQASPATTYYMTRNALLFFRIHAPGPWKWLAPAMIPLRTARTVGAWSLKPKYRQENFRRKRDANLLAVRDFLLGRFGKMGPDVARACLPQSTERGYAR